MNNTLNLLLMRIYDIIILIINYTLKENIAKITIFDFVWG